MEQKCLRLQGNVELIFISKRSRFCFLSLIPDFKASSVRYENAKTEGFNEILWIVDNLEWLFKCFYQMGSVESNKILNRSVRLVQKHETVSDDSLDAAAAGTASFSTRYNAYARTNWNLISFSLRNLSTLGYNSSVNAFLIKRLLFADYRFRFVRTIFNPSAETFFVARFSFEKATLSNRSYQLQMQDTNKYREEIKKIYIS